jgi:hypothetical protein
MNTHPLTPQRDLCLAEGLRYAPTLHAFTAASGVHLVSLSSNVGIMVEYHIHQALRMLQSDLQDQHQDRETRARIIGATIALAAVEVCKFPRLAAFKLTSV